MKGVPFPAASRTRSRLVLVWLRSDTKHVSADAVRNACWEGSGSSAFSWSSVLAVGL